MYLQNNFYVPKQNLTLKLITIAPVWYRIARITASVWPAVTRWQTQDTARQLDSNKSVHKK